MAFPRGPMRPDVPGRAPITTLPPERMYERRSPLAIDGVDEAGQMVDPEQIGDEGQRLQKQADDNGILALARTRFQSSSQSESLLRQEMLEDLRFKAGQQWPEQIRTDRSEDERPCLTINRIPQFVRQITNPQRQTRPTLQVNPIGDGADKDTAEVIQGLIRHIENYSHAEVAYDEAYEDAVVMGRGWFRILTEFSDDGTFEQEIVVKRVPNAFTVYPDPAARELDYSDARYMFVVEDLPKSEYEEVYGHLGPASSLELFRGVGDMTSADWFPEGKVRVAEYWYVEQRPRTIAMVEGLGGVPLTVPIEQVPGSMKILQTRNTFERTVWWIKMNGAQILERQKWPGKWIPIVPILGDEIDINGRRDLVGIVRYARDPQRMYNYWVSAQTEMIALAPRTPVIGAEGQFKGYEEKWRKANKRNIAYLEYVPKSLDGNALPPPQRQQFEPPIAAIGAATAQADNDLKSVIGFFDASLGKAGPEESGKAILARQKQGETANSNFIDNYGRALWHAGRIYLDLIPKVFNGPRVFRLLGGDDQERVVGINQQWMEKGVPKLYDVRTGRYAVTMTIAPNNQTRRQEAAASMLQLVQSDPNLMNVIGDLMVAAMDWPNAEQVSQRLKKMLPPQLADDPSDPMPPEAQQKIAMLEQQLQMVSGQLQEAAETIRTKRLELTSREYIAAMNDRTQMTIALEKINAELAQVRLQAEIDRLNQMMAANNDRHMAEIQHIHDLDSMEQQSFQRAMDQQQQGAPPGAPGPGGGGQPVG